MIIFLHGSNAYHSRQKLHALMEQFKRQRDPRGDSVVVLDAEKLTLDELNSKMASQSLLAQKRLIVVRHLFSHREEHIFKDVLAYLQSIEANNDNVLIFYESKALDVKTAGSAVYTGGAGRPASSAGKLTAARKKLFDYLAGQKYSKKFSHLNRVQLASWLTQTAAAQGVVMAPNEAARLINHTGNDLWALHHEMRKLIHFAKGSQRTAITAADIRLLVPVNTEENIFSLTDAVSNNNPAAFFSLLADQLEAGVSLQQILIMLTRQFKIILQVKELLVSQHTPAQITARLKLHPFVVQKATPQTRNFSLEYLKGVIRSLIDIDCQSKTGQADALTGLSLLFAK